MLNEVLDALKAEFKGYHLTINLYPSGGMLEAEGCSDCGTDDTKFASAIWRTKRGETFDSAKRRVKAELGV